MKDEKIAFGGASGSSVLLTVGSSIALQKARRHMIIINKFSRSPPYSRGTEDAFFARTEAGNNNTRSERVGGG